MTYRDSQEQARYRQNLIAVIIDENPQLSSRFHSVDLGQLIGSLPDQVLERIFYEEETIEDHYDALTKTFIDLPRKSSEFRSEIDYTDVDKSETTTNGFVESAVEKIAQSLKMHRSNGGRACTPRTFSFSGRKDYKMSNSQTFNGNGKSH